MKKVSTWLSAFRANVHSQCGEDGVIQKILETIPDHDRWCVEFGAWNGEHLSNTCNLIENGGYSAVLIEGSAKKSVDLRARYAGNAAVIPVNQYVGCADDNNLDHILSKTPIPVDFDFLSIDIDGNDYHVWKAISRYKPKVVCIEFNPTIPTEIRFVQPSDPSVSQGTSLLSLVELGTAKGYELVSVLPWNAFFVRSEYYPSFEIDDNRPEVLRTDFSEITHLFSGYDGTIFLAGSQTLPWHGIKIQQSRMQYLPRLLRGSTANSGRIRRVALLAYEALFDPRSAARKVRSILADRRSSR
jgi:hypothetical protein